MSITVRPLTKDDEAKWLPLWQGYLKYYRTELANDITQSSWGKILDPDSGIQGLCAVDEDGALVGLVHFIFHPVTWSKTKRCYLEDLFTSQAARGKGVGAALIDAVAKQAKAENADQLYWLTESYNERAQALYNKVATKTHFIKYMKTL